MPATFGGYAYGSTPYAGTAAAGGGGQVVVNGGLYPQVTIEIAPGYSPFQTAPVWVDVTADVGEWETRIGRQHELGRFEPSSAKVTLDNRPGTYYPFSTTGPYATQLIPGLPLRIRCQYSGAVWPIYYGFVESFKTKWKSHNESDIEFQCKDLLKFLNTKRIGVLTTYYDTVILDAPIAYWRLDEAAGSTTAADITGNGHSLTTINTTTSPIPSPGFFGAAGALAANTNSAFDCGSAGTALQRINDNFVGTFPHAFSMELWVNARQPVSGATPGRGQGVVCGLVGSGVNNFCWLKVLSTGVIFDMMTANVQGATATTTSPITDGKWHHLVATMSADGLTASLYVDGVLAASNTSANALGIVPIYNFIGGSHPVFTEPDFNGIVDEVAFYNVTLTQAQVTAHYQAGAQPLGGQTSGVRIAQYAAIVGVPSYKQVVDAGQTTLIGATNDLITQTMLANAQKVADTEFGFLFVDGAGNLVFWDRLHTSKPPNSLVSLILGDAGLPAEEPYIVSTLDLQRDDLDTYNEIVVTPLGLAPQTVSTVTAGDVGRTLKRDNELMQTTTEAFNKATFLYNRYKTALDRVRAVSFTPMSDPNILFPAALGFPLLTQVEVRRRPADATGALFDQSALIEGIEHHVKPGEWTTTWRLSPTDATQVGIFGYSTFGNSVFGY